MELLKFKTNLPNQEAVAKLAPLLEEEKGISRWEVDTDSADKILSVSGENLNPQSIENAVAQAGFKAETLRILGLGGEDL
ncbi:heavy-metal-associated domain-containing protein [Sabulibacter ruber]|uniref:heavy-metal-associated domain-containing protein n=1 Tax=Sabulibacter ruber TaxID=2811901 RepID=UPI001A977B41|nr:copper chaperone [Sabulibacter ruber]